MTCICIKKKIHYITQIKFIKIQKMNANKVLETIEAI